jgi:hypothetical protein
VHEETADLLVVAQGAGAELRSELTEVRGVNRVYAGYIAFRGVLEEKDLPEDSRKVLAEQFTVLFSVYVPFLGHSCLTLRFYFQFFHAKGTQCLSYFIPGFQGTVEPGKRLMNWVSA